MRDNRKQMLYNPCITINRREISLTSPAYFIADIASNHDGDLNRAKDLIWKAKEAGTDAVKFQHFLAEHIVSEYGFRHLRGPLTHQAAWKKSVVEVYRDCALNRNWNDELAEAAEAAGVEFLTTPYDIEALEGIDPLVKAYKVGSGDITWLQFVERVAQKGKPVLLATGASSMEDVQRCVSVVLRHNPNLAVLQCNTNYTGDRNNFHFINLLVLKSLALSYPGMLLGLSDHTPGHAAALGAVALGARIVEKHFTDDNSREGPDHAFSMNPVSWKEMVERTRELELALGNGVKQIEKNEIESAVVQRRCLRFSRAHERGAILTSSSLECLRPAPYGSIEPYRLAEVLGRRLNKAKDCGDALYPEDMID